MSDVGNVIVGSLLFVGGAALTIFTGGILSTAGLIMMNAGAALLQAGIYGLMEEQESIRSNLTGQQSDIPIIYGERVKVGHVNSDVYTWGTEGQLLYMVGVLGVTSDNGGKGIGAVKYVYNETENSPMTDDNMVLDTWGTSPYAGSKVGVVEPFDTVYLTGTFSGSIGSYTAYSYHAHSGADTDNAVDAMLNYTRPEGWPTTSKGEGLSYVVNCFRFNEGTFSSFPQVTYVVDGNKIEDFRTSGPTLYDSYTNPALVLYDYLVSERYGLGFDPSEIDVAGTFTSAANWCDLTTSMGGLEYGKLVGSGRGLNCTGGNLTLTGAGFEQPSFEVLLETRVGDQIRIVSGPNSGSEFQISSKDTSTWGNYVVLGISSEITTTDTNMSFEIYDGTVTTPYEIPNAAISGVLRTGSSHKDNIDKILDAMRGKLYWQDGKVKLWVRKPETAQTFVLDADTNVDEIEIVRAGIQEVYNTVSARYVDPAQNYEIEEIVWPAHTDAPNLYLAEDNDVPSQLEVEYPLVQNAQVAWKFAEVALKESRQDVTVRLTTTEAALQFSLGDVVKLNDDTVGWTAKEFWVFGMTLKGDSTIEMLLKEYDSSVYTSSGQMTESGVPGGRLPSPLYMAAPTGLTLLSDDTTVIAVDDTGDTYLQQIKVDWTPSLSSNLYKEEVYYREDGDTVWTFGGFRYEHERDTGTNKQTLLVGPAAPVTDHNVKVEAVSRLGIRSAPVTDDITTASVPGFGGGTGSCPNLMGHDAVYRQGGEPAGTGTVVQHEYSSIYIATTGLTAGEDVVSFCADLYVRDGAETNPTNVGHSGRMGRRKEGLLYSLGAQGPDGNISGQWPGVQGNGGVLVKKGIYALEFDRGITQGDDYIMLAHPGTDTELPYKLYVQAYYNYEGVASPMLGENAADPDTINLLATAPQGRRYKSLGYNQQYYMTQPTIGFTMDAGATFIDPLQTPRGYQMTTGCVYGGLWNGAANTILYRANPELALDSSGATAARMKYLQDNDANEPVKMFIASAGYGISAGDELWYIANPSATPLYSSDSYFTGNYWWLYLGLSNETGDHNAGIGGLQGLNTDLGKIWWYDVKLFRDHVTKITGLTAGDYVKLVYEDEELNDHRYAMSIEAADANGEVDMWWNWNSEWTSALYGISTTAPNFSCRAPISSRFEIWDGPPWDALSTRTWASVDEGYAIYPGDEHEYDSAGLHTEGETLSNVGAVLVLDFLDSSGNVITSVESAEFNQTLPTIRTGLANTLIPAGTDVFRFTLEKRGSANGVAWAERVQFNGGSSCCFWSSPVNTYLPPDQDIGDGSAQIIIDPDYTDGGSTSDDPSVQLAIDEHREGGGNLLIESRDEQTTTSGTGDIDGTAYAKIVLADHGIEPGDVISIRGKAKAT